MKKSAMPDMVAAMRVSRQMREAKKVASALAPSEPAGPAKVVGSVSTGCLSALDCQSLLCRWTARAEMFRGAWKICRFRDGGPDHAGMLKYDYAATALEAAIREMREQMEAATVRQPTDNIKMTDADLPDVRTPDGRT